MMKSKKDYSEWVRIGIALFLAIVFYELIIVQLLGKKAYDVRIGEVIYMFSPRLQLIPVILLSFFIVYFISEFRFRFKRVKHNLLILFCGIGLLLICFFFAKHIHQLYITFEHKFDSLPRNTSTSGEQLVNPARNLAMVRNVFLLIDAALALCMVYLWYNWAEVPAKKAH